MYSQNAIIRRINFFSQYSHKLEKIERSRLNRKEQSNRWILMYKRNVTNRLRPIFRICFLQTVLSP